MPNRVQTLRSSVPGNVPQAGTRQPGELWVNFVDSALGFIDGGQTAQKLLAVRLFVNTANYTIGDFVVWSGNLFCATAPSAPGAFVSANWAKVCTMQDLAPYLPLTGGTLSGPLTLAADPTTALGAATRQYADAGDASKLPLAGGTLTGPLILSGPPTQALQAATKAYVDTGAFLPVSGGTLTGDLTVAKPTPQLILNKPASGGEAYLWGQTNGVGRWRLTMGNSIAESGGNAGSNFSLVSYGDTGAIIASPFQINRANSAASFVGSGTFGGAVISPAWYYSADNSFNLSAAPTERYLQFAGGWYFGWNTSTGALRWVGNPGAPAQLMTLDPSGNFSVTGRVTSAAVTTNAVNVGSSAISTGGISSPQVVASGGLYAGTTVFWNYPGYSTTTYLGISGPNPILSWASNWYDYWRTTDGARVWICNGAANHVFDGSGNYTISGNGWKPGGGAWAATSDARIKRVRGDYTLGLDEVLQLRPVVFTYLGNDTTTEELDQPGRQALPNPETGEMEEPPPRPKIVAAPYPGSVHYQVAVAQKPFVGFIAQEIETVLPDAVSQRAGFIDGQPVADLREVDTTELIYALVNSVKTLAARVEDLEAMVIPR